MGSLLFKNGKTIRGLRKKLLGHKPHISPQRNKRIDLLGTSSGYRAPYALAVDATAVYWTESGSVIKKVGLAGGTPVTLASQDNFGDSDITLDATSVYWSNCTDGTIMKVGK